MAKCECCGDEYESSTSTARDKERFCNWMCEAIEEAWDDMRNASKGVEGGPENEGQ